MYNLIAMGLTPIATEQFLQITQPPLRMGLFIFTEPFAWEIQDEYHAKPNQVNPSQTVPEFIRLE